MPGLVQVRPIELPFMRKGELLRVLQRDAARFFFCARDEQVVAIRHLHRARGRRAVLAAAAPRWLIELLVTQLEIGGLRVDQIVPAYAAWAVAVHSAPKPKTSAPPRGWLAVEWGGSLELLELRGGDVRQVRRLRANCEEAMVRDIAGCQPIGIASVTTSDTAMAVAARYAGRARNLVLVAPSVAALELRRAGRQARWLVSAAAVLFAVSSLLRLVDVNRELAHVRATRQRMEREVGAALNVRAKVSGVERLVALLCEIHGKAPRWSDAMVTVATNLPLDAHVLRFNAAGDSVTLEGATQRASVALDQLRAAPGVIALHASAPIRLETNSGEDPTEYFTVVMRFHPTAERGRRQ